MPFKSCKSIILVVALEDLFFQKGNQEFLTLWNIFLEHSLDEWILNI